jgi:hypothetical protein
MNSVTRQLLLALVFVGGVAKADGPACRTFERTPACCPHPPPTCCPALVGGPLDDATVLQVCGTAVVKGQTGTANQCRRYFERDALVGEVVFGREPGDAGALEKMRAGFGGARARVETVTVVGTQRAFVLRQTDETGKVERVSVWALVGSEIAHLEVERSLCGEDQALRLFARAIERMRAAAR